MSINSYEPSLILKIHFSWPECFLWYKAEDKNSFNIDFQRGILVFCIQNRLDRYGRSQIKSAFIDRLVGFVWVDIT